MAIGIASGGKAVRLDPVAAIMIGFLVLMAFQAVDRIVSESNKRAS